MQRIFNGRENGKVNREGERRTERKERTGTNANIGFSLRVTGVYIMQVNHIIFPLPLPEKSILHLQGGIFFFFWGGVLLPFALCSPIPFLNSFS